MEIKIGAGGEVSLPGEVCQRYGLTPDSPMRLIETENAILLVPLKDKPSEELDEELRQWQSLGVTSWDEFPYEQGKDA